MLLPALTPAETAIADAAHAQALKSADVHLHSNTVVIGYDIQACDGSIGRVQASRNPAVTLLPQARRAA